MFKKILLCTDGSDQALSAAHLTANLACRTDACFHLVHVLDPIITADPSALAPESGLSAEITLRYEQQGQQAILERTARVLEQAHVPCQSHAEFGHPVAQIHHIAEQEQVDLIVLGSRGLSAWPALLLGSISEGVAHHASCPVLIVRGDPKEFHRLVIASDGSVGAGHAARAGMELAKDYQADVSVLNVFQPFTDYPGVSSDDLDPDACAAQFHASITSQVDPIAQEFGVSYQLFQEIGHPAQTLVEFASKKEEDLIVVGSRGLGGFKRLLLGSVSASVLHHAHCSILVVR